MKYGNRKSSPTAEMIAARKEFIVKGMTMTADVGGPVTFRTAESPLDEAIRRMTKARDMAGEIAAALRQKRH